jgi:hypothetical protein
MGYSYEDPAMTDQTNPLNDAAGEMQCRICGSAKSEHDGPKHRCPRSAAIGESGNITFFSEVALPPVEPADGGEAVLVEQGYSSPYDAFRNKWIGDHEGMIADLVRDFVPRATPEPLPAGLEERADDDEGPIADAARRIASWTEGAARLHVYKVAKRELTALSAGERK